jgi:hypothetical protein
MRKTDGVFHRTGWCEKWQCGNVAARPTRADYRGLRWANAEFQTESPSRGEKMQQVPLRLPSRPGPNVRNRDLNPASKCSDTFLGGMSGEDLGQIVEYESPDGGRFSSRAEFRTAFTSSSAGPLTD